MAKPLLGWIAPQDRTQAQADAHERAMANVPRFAIPPVKTDGPVKVMLTDLWKDPLVVADIGFEFTGYRQLTGSCFPAGTPVRMADGSEKAVEDVTVGDEVVTHLGRRRPVKETMRRSYTGDMISFDVSGFPFPLEMTADHQVAISCGNDLEWKRADEVAQGDRVLIGWGKEDTQLEFLDIASLLGDQATVLDDLMKDHAYTKGQEPDVPHANIGMARRMVLRSGIDWRGRIRLHQTRIENAIPRHVPVCPSLARFVGLYLAEGGCHEGRVTFTFNADETKTLAAETLSLARGLFGAEGELVRRASTPNTVMVRFANANLAAVLKALMPGNVYTKRVPAVFFRADENTRLSLLLGWMDGDGCVTLKKGKKPGNVRITGVTVNPGLARDMTTIAFSCGLKATASRRKARKQSKASYNIDLVGRKAVSLFPAVAHRADGSRYTVADKAVTPFGYARVVRSVTRRPVEMLPVFDFEVEEDHSFIASGIVVHNCVGVSTGNAVATLSFVQRKLSTNPQKAILPWWPFDYGRCRTAEGDRGQGEGAVDSVMGQTLIKEGVVPYDQAQGLPTFDRSDGFALTSHIEMQWSDGQYSGNTALTTVAKAFPLGSAATLSSTEDIKTAILTGHPVLDGCNDYVGHGSLQGDVAIGDYDGRGGHSTCFLGYWDHPNLGPLFLYSNQWDGNTYPADGSGRGRCTVWMKEASVARLFSMGGNDGETMALSSLKTFPTIAPIIDWSTL